MLDAVWVLQLLLLLLHVLQLLLLLVVVLLLLLVLVVVSLVLLVSPLLLEILLLLLLLREMLSEVEALGRRLALLPLSYQLGLLHLRHLLQLLPLPPLHNLQQLMRRLLPLGGLLHLLAHASLLPLLLQLPLERLSSSCRHLNGCRVGERLADVGKGLQVAAVAPALPQPCRGGDGTRGELARASVAEARVLTLHSERLHGDGSDAKRPLEPVCVHVRPAQAAWEGVLVHHAPSLIPSRVRARRLGAVLSKALLPASRLAALERRGPLKHALRLRRRRLLASGSVPVVLYAQEVPGCRAVFLLVSGDDAAQTDLTSGGVPCDVTT